MTWVNPGRLPHVLEPSCYYDQQHYEREVARVFEPAWHFAATRNDLAVHGSFVTFEAFGHPVLVRNHEGTLHAYQNVCAHRHAKLTGEARGQCDQLRCQYHGWEYGPDGSPSHVREADCFRPIEKGAQRLRKFEVATCGQLVFVALGATCSLDDYLGPRTRTLCETIFADTYRQIDASTVAHPANWKIPIENGLESYHVPVVHGGSFEAMPLNPLQRHELGDGYSVYEDVEPPASRAYRFVMRRVRRDPNYRYHHHHHFPNLTFVHTDISSYVQSVVPLSATTSVSHIRLFGYDGDGRVQKLTAQLLRRPLAKFAAKVLAEDAPLIGDVQQGMNASRQRGVIGACEERVFAFQEWLARRTAERELPPDPRARGTATFQ